MANYFTLALLATLLAVAAPSRRGRRITTTSGKKAASSRNTGGRSLPKRLLNDLAKWNKDPISGIELSQHEENGLIVDIAMRGPQDTPYAGGIFKLTLTFSSDYPMRAPKLIFRTKIYHPNVDSSSGAVCMGLLKNDWTPRENVTSIVQAIQTLLVAPNPDDPLEKDIATQYTTNYELFERTAKEWIDNYANA